MLDSFPDRELDLTTAAGRAMAHLLAIVAEFEREILRERTRASLTYSTQNGEQLGRSLTARLRAAKVPQLHSGCILDSTSTKLWNEIQTQHLPNLREIRESFGKRKRFDGELKENHSERLKPQKSARRSAYLMDWSPLASQNSAPPRGSGRSQKLLLLPQKLGYRAA